MLKEHEIRQILNDHGIYDWILIDYHGGVAYDSSMPCHPPFYTLKIKAPKRKWRSCRKELARYLYEYTEFPGSIGFIGVKKLHEVKYYLKDEECK